MTRTMFPRRQAVCLAACLMLAAGIAAADDLAARRARKPNAAKGA